MRAWDVGGRRLALAQAASAPDNGLSPIAELFGYEPTGAAIGFMDRDFTITSVSSDITGLLGVCSQDLVGRVLLDAVAGRDVAPLVAASGRLDQKTVELTIHLQNSDQEWGAFCCLMTSLEGSPDRCFMLARAPDPRDSRISELEQHLWRIASIVEASGVMQRVGSVRDLTAVPEVNSLTTRQWEVLARIVRGERVPTIAAALHVSQSTVRSHLSVIFKRFGVCSQPDLMRVIEGAPELSA